MQTVLMYNGDAYMSCPEFRSFEDCAIARNIGKQKGSMYAEEACQACGVEFIPECQCRLAGKLTRRCRLLLVRAAWQLPWG